MYKLLKQKLLNCSGNSPLVYEVCLDFARTMNKIIMDYTLEKPAEELEGMIPANLTQPEKPKPKPCP